MWALDWSKYALSPTRWLEPAITEESILHCIQHLGIKGINVVKVELPKLTKRPVIGFIVASHTPIEISDQRPYVFASDEHLFGPTQMDVPTQDFPKQEKRILPQAITNSALSVNLVNYALLGSTKFAERCGPFLAEYFRSGLPNGDDLQLMWPLAFAHNLTARKYPADISDKRHITYFAHIQNEVSLDEERYLVMNESGEFVEFLMSDAGLLHLATVFGTDSDIFLIVKDDSKEMVEELVELRKQMVADDDSSKSCLETSSFFDQSSLLTNTCDDDMEFNAEPNAPLSELAELSVISENIVDASDFELIVDDGSGKQPEASKPADVSLESLSGDDDYQKRRFKELFKKIAAAKHEFTRLWFEGSENYSYIADPEYEAFFNAYRHALNNI